MYHSRRNGGGGGGGGQGQGGGERVVGSSGLINIEVGQHRYFMNFQS